MVIDDDARKVLGWEATTNIDPDQAVIVLEVGGTRYPMTWDAPAVQKGETWVRSAQTDGMLVGTEDAAVPQPGDIALGKGRHEAQVIVSLLDGQVLPARPFTIHVS